MALIASSPRFSLTYKQNLWAVRYIYGMNYETDLGNTSVTHMVDMKIPAATSRSASEKQN